MVSPHLCVELHAIWSNIRPDRGHCENGLFKSKFEIHPVRVGLIGSVECFTTICSDNCPIMILSSGRGTRDVCINILPLDGGLWVSSSSIGSGRSVLEINLTV